MSEGEGERWGSYVLESRIGAGGMAEVFRARRTGAAAFSRLVCIKRLHAHLSKDPDFVQMFLDEAHTGARLRHRNIVAIDDLGEHDGRYFLAMEFVNGVDLAALEARVVRTGAPFPIDAAVFIATELLTALESAHGATDPDDGRPLFVVHRDISPHNVLVSFGGEIKLTDFGIARAARRARVTVGDVVRGRFGYMPLEQASGRPLDARADLFALGVTLFELVTGRKPFRGNDPDATLEAIIAAQVINDRPAVRTLRSDLPLAFATLIERLLAIDPEGRPTSATEALAQLAGLRERITGAASLSALLATLYPSQASAAYVPRRSLPASLRPPPHGVSDAVDPYSRTEAQGFAPVSVSVSASAPASAGPSPTTAVATSASGATPFRTGSAIAAFVLVTTLGTAVLWQWTASPVAPHAVSSAARSPLATASTPATVSPVEARVTASPGIDVPPPALALVPSSPSSAPSAPSAPSAIEAPAPLVTGTVRTRAASPVPHSGGVRRAQGAETTSTARSTAATGAQGSATGAVREAPMESVAPPQSAQGSVRVVALPWGEVLIDGRPFGRAPVEVPLSAGEHTVQVTGGVEQTRRILVRPGNVSIVQAFSP